MKLEISINPEEDFIVPSGEYLVQCKSAFERDEPYKNQTSTSVRIKFDVIDMNHPTGVYVIGKRYPASLSVGSDLLRDLEGWLGRKKLLSFIKNGSFDFDELVGELATATVIQISNPGYNNPYCSIKKLAPPRLTSTDPSRPCANPAACIRNLPKHLNN